MASAKEPVGRPGLLLDNLVAGDSLLAVLGINDITLWPPEATYGFTHAPHPLPSPETICVPFASAPVDKTVVGQGNQFREAKSAFRLGRRSRVLEDRQSKAAPRLPRPQALVAQTDAVVSAILAAESSNNRRVIPNQGKALSFVSAASWYPTSHAPQLPPLLAASTSCGLLYLYRRSPRALQKNLESVDAFLSLAKDKAALGEGAADDGQQAAAGKKAGESADGGDDGGAGADEGGGGAAGGGDSRKRSAGNSGNEGWVDVFTPSARLALQNSLVTIGALAWSPPAKKGAGSILAVGGTGAVELLSMTRNDNSKGDQIQAVGTIVLAMPSAATSASSSSSSSPYVLSVAAPFAKHTLSKTPTLLMGPDAPSSPSSPSSSYFEQQRTYRAVLDEMCPPQAVLEADEAVRAAMTMNDGEGGAGGASASASAAAPASASVAARSKLSSASRLIRHASNVFRATAPAVTAMAWLQEPRTPGHVSHVHDASTPVGIGGDLDADASAAGPPSLVSFSLLAVGCSDGAVHLFRVGSSIEGAASVVNVGTLAPNHYRTAAVTSLAWQYQPQPETENEQQPQDSSSSRRPAVLAFSRGLAVGCWEHDVDTSTGELCGQWPMPSDASVDSPSPPSSAQPRISHLQARLRWAIETGEAAVHAGPSMSASLSRYWVISNASDSVISGLALMTRDAASSFADPSPQSHVVTFASLLGSGAASDAASNGHVTSAIRPREVHHYVLTSGLDGSVKAWSLEGVRRALMGASSAAPSSSGTLDKASAPVMTVLFSGISTSEGQDRVAHKVGNDMLLGLATSPNGLYAYVSCLRERATTVGGYDRALPDTRLTVRSVSLNSLFTPADVDREAEALLSLVALGMRPDPAEVPEWHLRKRAEEDVRRVLKARQQRAGGMDEDDYEGDGSDSEGDIEAQVARRMQQLRLDGSRFASSGEAADGDSKGQPPSFYLRPLGPAAAYAAGELSSSFQSKFLAVGSSLSRQTASLALEDTSGHGSSSFLDGLQQYPALANAQAPVLPADAPDFTSSALCKGMLLPPIHPAAVDLVSSLWSVGEVALSLERKYIRDAASAVGYVYQGLPVKQPAAGESGSFFAKAFGSDSSAVSAVPSATIKVAPLSPYDTITPENLPPLYAYLPRPMSEALAIPLDPHPGGSSFRAGTLPAELISYQRMLGFSRETVNLIMRPFTACDALGTAAAASRALALLHKQVAKDDDEGNDSNAGGSNLRWQLMLSTAAAAARGFLHLEGLHANGPARFDGPSVPRPIRLKSAVISLFPLPGLKGKAPSLLVPPVLPVHIALQHLLPAVCNQLLVAGNHAYAAALTKQGAAKSDSATTLTALLASSASRLQYLRLVVHLCSTILQGHVYASERAFGPFAFDGYSHAYMRHRSFSRDAYLSAQMHRTEAISCSQATSSSSTESGALSSSSSSSRLVGGAASEHGAVLSTSSSSSSASSSAPSHSSLSSYSSSAATDAAMASITERFSSNRSLRNFALLAPTDASAAVTTPAGDNADGSSSGSSASSRVVPVRSIGLPSHPLPPPISDGKRLQIVDGRGHLVDLPTSRSHHPGYPVPVQQRFAYVGYDFPLVNEFATQPPRWLWYACAMGTGAAALAYSDWLTASLSGALKELGEKADRVLGTDVAAAVLSGKEDSSDDDDVANSSLLPGSVFSWKRAFTRAVAFISPVASSGVASSAVTSSSSAASSSAALSLSATLASVEDTQQKDFAGSLAAVAAALGSDAVLDKELLQAGARDKAMTLGVVAAAAGLTPGSFKARGVTQQDHDYEVRAMTIISTAPAIAANRARNQAAAAAAAASAAGDVDGEEDGLEMAQGAAQAASAGAGAGGRRLPPRKAALKSVEATQKMLNEVADSSSSSSSSESDTEPETGSNAQDAPAAAEGQKAADANDSSVTDSEDEDAGFRKQAPKKRAVAAKPKPPAKKPAPQKKASARKKKKDSDEDDDFGPSSDEEEEESSTEEEDEEEESEDESDFDEESEDDERPKKKARGGKAKAAPKAAKPRARKAPVPKAVPSKRATASAANLLSAVKGPLQLAQHAVMVTEPALIMVAKGDQAKATAVILAATSQFDGPIDTSASAGSGSKPASAMLVDGSTSSPAVDATAAALAALSKGGISFVAIPVRRAQTLLRLARRARDVAIPALEASYSLAGLKGASSSSVEALRGLSSLMEALLGPSLKGALTPSEGRCASPACRGSSNSTVPHALASTVDFSPLTSTPYAWMTEQVALQPPPIFTVMRCLAAMETGCETLVASRKARTTSSEGVGGDLEREGEDEEEREETTFGLPVVHCGCDGALPERLHPMTLEPLAAAGSGSAAARYDPSAAGNIDTAVERLTMAGAAGQSPSVSGALYFHPANHRGVASSESLPRLGAGVELGSVTGMWWA